MTHGDKNRTIDANADSTEQSPAGLNLKKLLISGSAWALVGRLATALAGLGINAVLARVLAQDALGIYFLVVSFVTISVIVVQLGLQRAVVRFVSESVALQAGGGARSAVRLAATMSVVSSLVYVTFVMLYGEAVVDRTIGSASFAAVLGVACLLIVVRTLSGVLTESLRGFHNIGKAVFLNGTLINLVLLACYALFLAMRYPASLELIIACMVFASLLNLGIAWWYVYRNIRGLNTQGGVAPRRLLNTGLPLMVSSVAVFVFSQADLWIIGVLLADSDVGLYGSAARLVQVVAMPLMIQNAVLPSIVADLNTRGQKARLERVLRVVSTAGAIPAMLMLGVFILWSGPVLAVIYGAPFEAASAALVYLSLGQLANVVCGAAMVVLMMTGHQRVVMLVTVITGAGVIAGGVAAAQVYALDGVAAVYGIGTALQAAVFVALVKSRLDVWSLAGLRPALQLFDEARLVLNKVK